MPRSMYMTSKAIHGFLTVEEARAYKEEHNIEGEIEETCQGNYKIVKK